MRHEVYVEVRARYKMLENDDEGTACRDPDDNEDTEFNCRSRCRMNLIRVHCCFYSSFSNLLIKIFSEDQLNPIFFIS